MRKTKKPSIPVFEWLRPIREKMSSDMEHMTSEERLEYMAAKFEEGKHLFKSLPKAKMGTGRRKVLFGESS